ncbi:hypothetical protein D3C86_1864550 [compost metagenome]
MLWVFQPITAIDSDMTKIPRPTPIQPAPEARLAADCAPGFLSVLRICQIRTAKKASMAPPHKIA